MRSRRLLVLVLAISFTVLGCGGAGDQDGSDAYPSHAERIYVDGDGVDWEGLPVRRVDTGDGTGVGIERLWTAHSDRHFFLRMELDRPINLQEGNTLTLFLDTDDDTTTGRDTLGLGAELTWNFGERSGRFRGDEITHADIGFASLPTVHSDTFEVALDRSATPNDSAALFPGDRFRLAVAGDGERVPDGPGGVGYELSDDEVALEAPALTRPDSGAVRLTSYNAVNNFDRELNSLFIEDRQPHYRRILGAIGADVIGFQEVYDQGAEDVEATAEGELGLPDAWHWAKEGQDLVLGSRFSILDTHAIPGYEDYESGAFLLDTREALGSQLVVVNMHPPCCNDPGGEDEPSSDAQRQQVVDGVGAFMRRVKAGEGPFDVAAETPVVILGDMNFVGDPQQPQTLRRGEIVNEDRFGPATAPDWDGSPLLDTAPRQVASPMHITWTDAESSFPPGRLDYAYVTDSVLEVPHEFVLYTPVLPDRVLQERGLQAEDTNDASDHLPVVIDVQAR
jgi:endonuclease/exonuclease/phosphatase family metal-dependent hydrolase